MKSGSTSLTHASLLVALVFVAVTTWAANTTAIGPRDFAGFYDISQVNDLGDRVQLVLTIRITNYSSVDLTRAIVWLQQNPPSRNNYGAFKAIAQLPSRGYVLRSKQFTVSRADYASWRQGTTRPTLAIQFRDGAGVNRLHGIEIVHRPLPTAAQ